MTQTAQDPPRPKLSDHLILLALETHHSDKAHEWNFQDIVDQYIGPMDGYDLMRNLEAACYWDGSRELIDELDSVCFSISRTVDQATKDWVVAYNVEPKLPPGTEVIYRDKKALIKDIDPAMGRYSIQFYEPFWDKLPCLIGSNSSIYANYEEVENEQN